jgi:hypothetical protein
MHFKVTAQYAGARELPGEQFNDITAAKTFIEEKMRENAVLKVKVIYRLYEWDDLLQEFDPSKMEAPESSSSDSSGSQGPGGAGARFRPTPLNVTPRPPGIPPNWIQDEEDDKKGKK